MTEPSAVEQQWDFDDPDMVREIMRQGEIHLQAQVQLAIAADQRATTTASILASAAVAIAAAFVALWHQARNGDALIAALVGAGCLLVGAGFAAYAARPTSFRIPGNHPNQWYDGKREPLATMLGGQAEHYQSWIEHNDNLMRRNGEALLNAFRLALLAPLLALFVWCCLVTPWS